ncbi:MAG: transcription antitermination factor NusB [Bdellovibrionota bacterium]
MRRQAREVALQILFQSEFAPQISISTFLEVYEGTINDESLKYANLLVEGTHQMKEKIDSLIQSHAQHWKIDRMATVDRNILRIAVYEMKFAKEILKPHMAINEAVEIAKKFSTEDSSSFINGVLDQVSKS